jgi:site-specific recombinase XerD
MNDLASCLSAFLNEHLPRERGASPHTCQSYAYSFQILVKFAAERHRVRPSDLCLEHLGAATVLAFLDHLEAVRGCTARTRNARLAAIKSFFRFLEYRLPACLAQARQIHAIPMKRFDEALVAYLTVDEVQAVLDAPDPGTASGLRDCARRGCCRCGRGEPGAHCGGGRRGRGGGGGGNRVRCSDWQ